MGRGGGGSRGGSVTMAVSGGMGCTGGGDFRVVSLGVLVAVVVGW